MYMYMYTLYVLHVSGRAPGPVSNSAIDADATRGCDGRLHKESSSLISIQQINRYIYIWGPKP